MFLCPECEYQHEQLNSLRIHAAKIHKMPSEELYLKVVANGIKPTCLCGCGEHTKFRGLFVGYAEYRQGHVARIVNNWGHNEKALEKSLEKRREMWKNGEIQGWCKGLTKEDPRIQAIIEKMNTPERAAKLSKSLTGVPKSKSHRKKIQEHMRDYWSKEENRSKQSKRQSECIVNGMLTKATRVYGYYQNALKSSKHPVYYRSNFELNAIEFMENDDDVVKYEHEPFRIKYELDGKIRYYVIDFVIERSNGKKYLIEVKPHCYTNYERYKVNFEKFKSAQQFGEANGYEFEVWTEKTHPFLAKKNESIKN